MFLIAPEMLGLGRYRAVIHAKIRLKSAYFNYILRRYAFFFAWVLLSGVLLCYILRKKKMTLDFRPRFSGSRMHLKVLNREQPDLTSPNPAC